MVIKNSYADEAKGSVLYGCHFYPGVAEYKEPNGQSYRVFLNEDTIRSMDPSFAGCPVFVLHVDEIETDLNELRKEADGWVIESFYNQADGKHWVKFICVSEKGAEAIKKGYSLSNCYIPKTFGSKGEWNGLIYDKEITSGEYEHLAIVPNPRYVESVIMTPDDFKKYNEDKLAELKKLANSNNDTGETKMKFSFFKRAKVDNSADLETMSVVLPKSGREVEIVKLINDADEKEMKKGEPKMAHPDHHVQIDDSKMTVNELVSKYKAACNDLDEMKKKMEMKKDDSDPAADNVSEDQDMETAKKEVPKSDDDKMGEKETMKLEKEEEKEVKDAKKKNSTENFDRLKNAPSKASLETAKVVLSKDQVVRGKSLYGSN